MAPKQNSKKHSGGKKRSRCMNGGMTTGQWGVSAYGASDSQQAVGNGSNVIRMHDPNSVVAAPQMKGGRRRRYRGGADQVDGAAPGIMDQLTGAYNKATEYATKYATGIAGLTGPATASADNNASAAPAQEPVASADNNATVTEEAATVTEEAAPEPVVTEVTGGKSKRKSATKRRKSHKKKGKSSKKRAHKRH